MVELLPATHKVQDSTLRLPNKERREREGGGESGRKRGRGRERKALLLSSNSILVESLSNSAV